MQQIYLFMISCLVGKTRILTVYNNVVYELNVFDEVSSIERLVILYVIHYHYL